MDDLEPFCACGTERVVIHGGYASCGHCDRPCINPGCEHCAKLALTCAYCRTIHTSVVRRAKCEAMHVS